jgi:hypothetical protein
MRFSVDRQHKAARAAACIVCLLLTPILASADTLTPPPEPRDGTHTLGAMGPGAQESRLDHMRDMAIEESLAQGNPSATTLSPFRAPLHSSTPTAAGTPPQNPIKELSNTLKETIRPTYQEALDSGVVSAVRSLTSDGDSARSVKLSDANAGDEGEAKAQHLVNRGRTWDTADEPSRPQTPQEKEADHVRAEVLLMALIDEIKPWALSAAGLYGLYHLVRFGLAYHRRKSGRHRRRSRSSGSGRSSSSSHHSRSPQHRTRTAAPGSPVPLPLAEEPSTNSSTR